MATKAKPAFLMGKETKREEAKEKRMPPKAYAVTERKEVRANPKVHAKGK